jgi:uncharacterized protein YjbI with pentapeptide repeats
VLGSEGGEMSERRCSCGREAEIEGRYCIFHAPINKKKPKDFWVRFKTYFEENLEEYKKAENKAAFIFNCAYFVFPPFGEWRFPKEIPFNITFTNAVFYGDAEFTGLEFKGQVVFVATEFRRCPEFLLIKMYTTMGTLEYPGFANFNEAVFSSIANFAGSKFYCVAKFHKGEFLSDAVFNSVEFHEEADFHGNFFGEKAMFSEALFLGETRFTTAVFKEDAYFQRATFKGETYFSESEFRQRGLFIGIECFNYLFFDRVVNTYARDANNEFIRDVENNKKIIVPEAEIELTYCHFYDKSEVYTYKTPVRKWRFIGTTAIKNPEIFGFEETVWKTEGDKRKTVYEEDLIGEEEITYERVGEMYRLLRRNFESNLAYEAASDFHIGEMEMLLAGNVLTKPKLFFLRWYKRLSNFGESVGRPLIWFGGLWLLFAVIWSLKGFPYNGGSVNFDLTWPWLISPDLEMAKDVGRSLLYSFKTFLTVPNLKEGVVSQTLGAVQRLAGVSVITLFILALRRAFRR